MAIYRRLQNTPLAKTGHLLAAYELTLLALNLVDRNDPLTTMIADKIIEIGITRLEDPVEISKRAVKFLTLNRLFSAIQDLVEVQEPGAAGA